MPQFSPFRGVRYAPLGDDGTDLSAVAAPPYDVVDDHERDALEAQDPHNSVRLILPRDEAGTDRYTAAARRFSDWTERGVLVRDETPRYYGYRMDYVDPHGAHKHTIGVLGALSLPAQHGEGDILPHERTMKKAKTDRLDLLRAMRVNVDPIWGLSLGSGLTALIDQSAPLCSAVDEAGVTHQLFAIDGPAALARIEAIVDAAPLVLADGHHRFETGCNYRDERAAAGAQTDGDGAILCFVVELSDDELCIEPIHRLVSLPGNLDARAALADAFTIEATDEPTVLTLVDAAGLWSLTPRAEVVTPLLADEHPVVATTDAAVVEHVIVDRWPGAEWVFRHDGDEIRALVAKGSYDAGLLLRAPTVATTRAAAEARVRMPQKTTFFWPKPRTGMVFRTLD